MTTNDNSILKELTTLLVAACLVPSLLLGQGVTGSANDELLVLIPADQVSAVRSLTPATRFYHRFPDVIFAGVQKTSAAILQGRGITATIVDRHPWTASYAVVSRHPGNTGSGIPQDIRVEVLYVWDDLMLVKGTLPDFEDLRAQGFVCVPVQRREITAPGSSVRLPRWSVTSTDTIETLVAMVSDSSVEALIQGLQDFGTRQWSRTNRDSVFSWVRYRFIETGINDVKLDSFQFSGTWQANVVATIPGTVFPESEIIVGGHLDSQNYSNPDAAPGADDNATGTVAALEMARVLQMAGYQPAFTLRFMGFAAEEAGLIGSDVYAQEARSRDDDIRVMMNYDMLGYRNQGSSDRDFNIVWYTGSEAYSDLHAATALAYTTLNPVFTTSYRSSSDSWSFYQEGYHTLFCIETDFNPYYHSQNDLLQYLDIPYATDIVRAGLAMLLTLDMLPPSVPLLEVYDRGDGTSLEAQWDATGALDVEGYNVHVGTSPGVYDNVYFEPGLSRTLSGLDSGVTYYIGISAVDMEGREGLIVEDHGMPLTIPLPPSGLMAETGPDGINLTWQTNRELDLAGYNVYRSEDSAGTFLKMNTHLLGDAEWTDTTHLPVVHYYCVSAVDASGNQSTMSDTVAGSPVTGVADWEADPPRSPMLMQNYPNPFNPKTEIGFQIADYGLVSIHVYDLLGRHVATLVDEKLPAGIYRRQWDASGFPSGVYFYRLSTEGFVQTRRLILLK